MSVDARLLDRLLRAGAPMPPAALARDLRLSVPEILGRVEELRRAGCGFDSHPQAGLRLTATGLGCWADYIEPRHADGLGRRLTVYQETASTQDAARKLLAGREAAHHVVVADHQTAGRGRLGRKWFAAPGDSLLLTGIVPLSPPEGGITLDRLMLASCCALARTIEGLTGLPAQIRWPNDVLIDRRKLAGILIETAAGHALIGIGLNVHPLRYDAEPVAQDGPGALSVARGEPFPIQPTSLAEHLAPPDRLLILDALLMELHAALHRQTDAELHAAWRRRSCLLQQRITVHSAGRTLTGRVLDLDPHHGLVLMDDHSTPHTLPTATTTIVSAC